MSSLLQGLPVILRNVGTLPPEITQTDFEFKMFVIPVQFYDPIIYKYQAYSPSKSHAFENTGRWDLIPARTKGGRLPPCAYNEFMHTSYLNLF